MKCLEYKTGSYVLTINDKREKHDNRDWCWAELNISAEKASNFHLKDTIITIYHSLLLVTPTVNQRSKCIFTIFSR